MENPKPFVAVACVCEKVLIEKDEVATVVRIVDTYTLSLPPPQESGVQFAIPLTAFVSLKSGDVTGEHEIRLVLQKPSGERSSPHSYKVILNGGEHGANLLVNFVLPKPEFGLYWFDVLWGDDVLTRIPFRLKEAEPMPDWNSPS